jgi:hypothetical protein
MPFMIVHFIDAWKRVLRDGEFQHPPAATFQPVR